MLTTCCQCIHTYYSQPLLQLHISPAQYLCQAVTTTPLPQAYRPTGDAEAHTVTLLCIAFNSVTCWPIIQVLRAGLALRRGQYSTAAGILAGRQPGGAEVSPLELIAATQDGSSCNAAALPRVQVCISFKCGRQDVTKKLGKGLRRVGLAVHLFALAGLRVNMLNNVVKPHRVEPVSIADDCQCLKRPHTPWSTSQLLQQHMGEPVITARSTVSNFSWDINVPALLHVYCTSLPHHGRCLLA